MGFFSKMKEKKAAKQEANRRYKKLDQMIDLWASDKLPSPWQELNSYVTWLGVEDGGHYTLFTTLTEDGKDINAFFEALVGTLTPELIENGRRAYERFLSLGELADVASFIEFDAVFNEHAGEYNDALNDFSMTLPD